MTKETKAPETIAIEPNGQHTAPKLVVAPYYKDPVTRALYLHRDLIEIIPPWNEESHVAPMQGDERFGDVESFVGYVARYGGAVNTLVTWNSRGLRAVLDYADFEEGVPGRCKWTASLPFRPSLQWEAWTKFASGEARSQKVAVETLEDLAADIKEPSPADLTAILRTLRATANAQADTELRPDGTSSVKWSKESKISGNVDLPSSFRIAVPVLKGHVDTNGRPVVYGLDVKVRASVDDNARLTLRFSLPNAERVLEEVYAERVAAAKALFGEAFDVLRAAD
ncbi:MAG: DUF2303 family protein [Patescibacteria group bacterium]|nr:DUF2303 family protein [Patescibacteria group bacterium]